MCVATSTAIGLGVAAAGVGAAAINAHAAGNASEAQTQANDKTLAFEREQAAQEQANFEAAQHANYNQYVSRARAAQSLGDTIGFHLPDPEPYTSTSGSASGASRPSGATPSGTSVAGAQAAFDKLFPGETLTPDQLASQEGALNAQGIKLLRNAAGRPGKILLADGTAVDVIQGAGSGLNRKQWLVQGAGGGTPTTRGLASPTIGSMLPGGGAAMQMAPSAPTQPFALRSINAFLPRS